MDSAELPPSAPRNELYPREIDVAKKTEDQFLRGSIAELLFSFFFFATSIPHNISSFCRSLRGSSTKSISNMERTFFMSIFSKTPQKMSILLIIPLDNLEHTNLSKKLIIYVNKHFLF